MNSSHLALRSSQSLPSLRVCQCLRHDQAGLVVCFRLFVSSDSLQTSAVFLRHQVLSSFDLIHIHGIVTSSVGRLSLFSLRLLLIADMVVQSLLAVWQRSSIVFRRCSFLGLLLLVLLERLSLWHDIGQKLEVLYTGDCVCC